MEEWKPVVGWEDKYAVSSYGRVKRISSNNGEKTDRLLNPYKGINYLTVELSGDNGRYRRSDKKGYRTPIFVHLLVASAFIGEKPKNFVTNHKDYNKLNNNLNNLEYISRRDNLIHGWKHSGKSYFGEGNHMHKLSDKQILEIRRKYKTNKYSQAELSRMYQVSSGHICNIVHNKIR